MFVKYTSVTPAPMVADTAWRGRSIIPCRFAGRTLIAEATVPDENISVTVITVPTGNMPCLTQNPAGTVKLAPALIKVKFSPGAMPAPAILQTFNKPISTGVVLVFRKVTIVCPPAFTVTVAVPETRLLLTSNPPGKVLTEASVVPVGKVSVMIVGPAATTRAGLQVPPGAAPAATVTGVPATLKVKFVPTGTPEPATLHTCTKPVVGIGGMTVSINVAMVCPPALTVTVAVPAARLLLTSNPTGKVLTEASVVPVGKVSVMIVGPAATTRAGLQDPPGAGPAATVTGVPATLKVKFVPTAIPAPATLHTCTKPVVGVGGITVSINVAMVCPPALTVTVAVPAARLLLTSNPAGKVLTEASVMLVGKASVIIVGPAATTRAGLQVPPGAAPAATVTGVPATLKVKFVPTGTPEPATLHTCTKPVVGVGGMIVSINVAMVCPPAFTVTVAVPAARLLLTSNPAGKVLTEASVVPVGKVSVILIAPDGTTKAGLQDPPGATPAATVTGVPATLKVKFVPTATPAPATLHTCTKPVVGVGGMTVLINVVMVCPPAFTVTVAVPAARLLLTSNPAGKVLTEASVVPVGKVSVITIGPAATTRAGLQVPPGAAPAATVTGVPATLKVKFVPTGTPEPATLHTCTKPVVGVGGTTVSINVAMVCPPALTVTVAVPAARLLLTSNPTGKVLTEANVVPVGKVSVIIVGPAATTKAGLQAPPGAAPAATVTGVPATLKVKFVPTGTPEPATLHTCTKPVVGVGGITVSVNVAMVCPPAFTVTVAVPAARLLLTSNPAGKVLTDTSVVPVGKVSVILIAPAATTKAGLQVPPGAVPAATVTGVPATLKVKFVPTGTPAPATLHTCTKPVAGTPLQVGTETTFESSVTAPFRPIALPDIFTLVVKVTLASAKMFPMN